jgi:eukaryotic-like serine/threonine-protein kinase
MPLVAGTRLGPYEIVAPAGAGGMGEVYRARDTRLNRDVAIKVLPEHLSSNPELRERFEREAKAISQLSHPHICVLYDIGKHEGADYLVLEYLEGETLGTRLLRGPLPTDQVLKYGAQMADALDKAHRHGVVHRDLKPDNVMLTKSGLKLLDFGLAKPVVGAVGVASSGAATMTHSPLTTEGTLVGTFQYMAPEQLEGQEADARSDIFGLGCVLYEMVTGRRAFEGKSTAKVVAAIMTTEPAPMTTVSPLTPAPLERAVKKCLAKDPEERWQSAGDLSSELRWISESGSQAGVSIPVPVRSQRKLLGLVALALVAAAGVLTGFLFRRPADRPALRVAINLPPGSGLVQGETAALSPDGQMVVMTLADADGKWRFWIRRLSSDTAQPMVETDGAINPFWSPDSQYVGFFASDGKLRKIAAVAGEHSEAVSAVPWSVYWGAWSREGLIVFSAGRQGLYQVSAATGTPVQVPISEKDQADYRWPSFLPDGKHLLVTSNNPSGGIFVVSLATGQVQPVLPTENGPAKYVEPGYILFLRGGVLLAQPFDARSLRVSGSAQSIAESVSPSTSFSVSDSGLLLYQRASQAQLTWVDQEGKKVSTVGDPGYLTSPYLSPDGRYATVSVVSPGQRNQKLWLYNLGRGTASPFTFGEGNDAYPAWSPDSQQVAFASTRGGSHEDIYVKPVGGGSSEQLLLGDEGSKEPDRWSADGRYILFDYVGKKTKATDIWALPMFGDRKPFPVVQSPGTDYYGTFSPDGKWVAYESDESGRGEIYVVPFPGPGGKWQVSTGGGVQPLWPPGKELFYYTVDSRLTAVEYATQGPNFIVGKSRLLFGGRSMGSITGADVSRNGADVSRTGKDRRWLMALPVGEPNASPLILTTNWTSMLKK